MSRWARRLGLVLATVLGCLGVAETITHLDDPGSLPFWSGCLFGGSRPGPARHRCGAHPADRSSPSPPSSPAPCSAPSPPRWTLLAPALAFATITVAVLDAGQRHDAAHA